MSILDAKTLTLTEMPGWSFDNRQHCVGGEGLPVCGLRQSLISTAPQRGHFGAGQPGGGGGGGRPEALCLGGDEGGLAVVCVHLQAGAQLRPGGHAVDGLWRRAFERAEGLRAALQDAMVHVFYLGRRGLGKGGAFGKVAGGPEVPLTGS